MARTLIKVVRCARYSEKVRGALLLRSLGQNTGLQLVGCRWVHTLLMNFSIDCVGVDSRRRVVSLRQRVCPNRVVIFPRKVSSIVEMAAGEVERLGIKIGSQISLLTVSRNSIFVSDSKQSKNRRTSAF